jgi:hypothetical protein
MPAEAVSALLEDSSSFGFDAVDTSPFGFAAARGPRVPARRGRGTGLVTSVPASEFELGSVTTTADCSAIS